MLRKILLPAALLAGLALPLAACADDTPAKTKAAAPDKLAAGQYEVTAKVTSFRSTDGKTPLIAAKVGDLITTRACVGADGTPSAELFQTTGDQCTTTNPYFSGGSINVTLDCTRKSVRGKIMVNVDGSTTADGLTGRLTTTTFIDGPGDYELKAAMTGKRTGACSAGPAPTGA